MTDAYAYLIDTHTHLDGPEFAEDIEAVITRAQAEGVAKMFVPGINWADTPHLLDLCRAYPNLLYPMVGLHPENVMDEDFHQVLDKMEKVIKESTETAHPTNNIIGIGEVGLDFYWDDTHKKEQIEAFETQVQWACKYGLPLMIHCRNAHKEMVDIMNKYREENLCGVFHCFTGTKEEALDLLSFPRFMLGIGGVLTFKKSTLRDVVKTTIPLSRIVLETDSPYMAPTPNRGKRNESSYVKLVALQLAETMNCNFQEIAHQTTANAAKVFTKASFFLEK